jgi:hypothetical protein
MRLMLLAFAALLLVVTPVQAGDQNQVEVTAKLVEIPGKFPPDDLYDYAYVMKYKVTGGKLDGQTILVAHYKPRRARKKIKDQMNKHVGGKLKRFKQGDVHVMTLDPDLQKIWPGAVIDDFFAADRTSTRYWCLKVDPKK